MSKEVAEKMGIDPDIYSALKNSIYPGAKDESILMVLAHCRAAKLDPMLKPVHIVPMSVKNPISGQYEWRDTIMPGIGLYRIQADRTGKYAGIDDPEFGPMVTETLDGVSITYPDWCKVTVKKILEDGTIGSFSAKEFWIENYAPSKKDTRAPNSMWRRRVRGQIAKCAEAQALRKAFPELGSQPTAEEMEGKFISDAIDDVATSSKTTELASLLSTKKAVQAPQKIPERIPSDVEENQIFEHLNDLIVNASSEQELKEIGGSIKQMASDKTKKELKETYKLKLDELQNEKKEPEDDFLKALNKEEEPSPKELEAAFNKALPNALKPLAEVAKEPKEDPKESMAKIFEKNTKGD